MEKSVYVMSTYSNSSFICVPARSGRYVTVDKCVVDVVLLENKYENKNVIHRDQKAF